MQENLSKILLDTEILLASEDNVQGSQRCPSDPSCWTIDTGTDLKSNPCILWTTCECSELTYNEYDYFVMASSNAEDDGLLECGRIHIKGVFFPIYRAGDVIHEINTLAGL